MNATISASLQALEEKLMNIVKPFFTNVDPAHDLNHTRRVLGIARQLAKAEGADLEIVTAAVILHDIGRANERITKQPHEEFGAEKSKEILVKHTSFTPEQIKHISNVILEHRGSKNRPCTSIESMVVKDADKIDSLGFIGAARTFAYAGTILQPMYVESDSDDTYTVLKEYETKLSKISERMLTESGRKLAEQRSERLKYFFEIYLKEIQGEL